MNFKSIYPILYLKNRSTELPGILDHIDYSELPIFVDFNIFQLTIINLFFNKYFNFSFIYEEEEKKYIKYFNEIRFTGNVEKKLFIKGSNQKNIINIFSNIETNNELGKNDYFLFVPSSLTSLMFLEESLANIKLTENLYRIPIENDETLFLVSKKFLYKNVIKSLSSLTDSVTEIEEILKNIPSKEIEIKTLYYGFKNIKDFIMLHFKLLEKNSSVKRLINLFNSFLVFEKPIMITKKGYVKNSILGKDSEIASQIYDSIIFKNVSIKENSEIINSIILPNNVIGKKSKIKNILLGLNTGVEKNLTIGNNCEIGFQLGKILKNIKYKKILPEGFTLIGNDVIIPSGFKVGKNCVIRGDVQYVDLKKMNILIDGGTLEK